MIDVILSCVESFKSKNRNCKISSLIFILKKKKEKRIEKINLTCIRLISIKEENIAMSYRLGRWNKRAIRYRKPLKVGSLRKSFDSPLGGQRRRYKYPCRRQEGSWWFTRGQGLSGETRRILWGSIKARDEHGTWKRLMRATRRCAYHRVTR